MEAQIVISSHCLTTFQIFVYFGSSKKFCENICDMNNDLHLWYCERNSFHEGSVCDLSRLNKCSFVQPAFDFVRHRVCISDTEASSNQPVLTCTQLHKIETTRISFLCRGQNYRTHIQEIFFFQTAV